MTSTEDIVPAGNDQYRDNHLSVMFRDGFSFSGYERDGLYLNVSRGPDSGAASGSGSAAEVGDAQRRSYANVSGVSGLDSPSDGRASVFADFDNDGDLDIFVTTIQGDAHLLYRNEIGTDRGFLRVSLRGTTSGRDAFGAVVRVKTSRGIQTQVKSGGEGYLSQHDPRLLFGLGSDEAADWIEVRWPGGEVERFDRRFPAGGSWLLVQGDPEPGEQQERRGSLPDPLGKDAALLASLGLEIGDPLPDFQITERDGSSGSWRDYLRPGRMHLVNLWATWCVPCRTEMPELQARAAEFSRSGIELLGVSIDTRGGLEPVNGFLEERSISYPVVLGAQTAIDEIYGDGDVFVPLTFIVDDGGRIESAFGGWSEESRRRLEKWMD